jgi:ABC transporter with metal-binding/Fe-S-binding domain ATP-binding protein
MQLSFYIVSYHNRGEAGRNKKASVKAAQEGMEMKLAALVSGGKDSLYAAYLASIENDIEYVISIISENPESYMFHYPNIRLVREQAKLMNVELIEKETRGEKEKELDDLEDVLNTIKDKIDGVITGAVASNYQKMRIDSICKSLGLLSFAPLWHTPPEQYMEKSLEEGFEMIIVGVGAPPLDGSWLGRKIDKDMINELVLLNKKHGIHVGGEGGEYESLVLDCPLFDRKIKVKKSDKIYNEKERSGTLNITEIELADKN